MRKLDSPGTAVVFGSSLVILILTVLFLRTLPPDQLSLLGRFLGPSALLWLGVYGILEHKRN